jgi:hypothetical protein
MSISITELTPGFMGEVSGVDITQPLTRAEVAELEAGMDRCAVLVYHDQRFTDAQQKAFSLNFGPLEETAGGNVTKDADRRLDPIWRMCRTLARTISLWLGTIGADCSILAISYGTPTVHSEPCRRSIRYCRDGSWWMREAIPSLPICGPLMTHWIQPRRQK